MKKAVKILLAILMIACLALAVTACDKECKPGEHQWKEIRLIKPASCSEAGSHEVECEKCGKTETQSIDKTAHEPEDVARLDPTCGVAGHEAGTRCQNCQEPLTGMAVINPTGNHDFSGEYTDETQDDTQHWKKCANCDAISTKENHSYDAHLTCVCGAKDTAHAVARIGGVYYADLATAVTEATAGAEITLMQNITLQSGITIADKAVIINLNNKNITVNDISTDPIDVFTLTGTAKLTVKGAGKVTNNNVLGYIVYAQDSAEVTIEAGTYYAVDSTIVQVKNTARAIINGGHFSVLGENEYGSKYILNKLDADEATAVISVAGGTFINFNPADVKGDPTDPTSYLKAGAAVKATTGDVTTYVVCSNHQYVASVCSICDHEIADADVVTALYALESGAALQGTYKLTGVVKSAENYSEQYGNRTLIITVGDKDVTAFRMKNVKDSEIDIATIGVGDTITVVGVLKNYNGTKEFDSGCTTSAIVARGTSAITVTVEGQENGTVSEIPESCENGQIINFTITTNEGYKVFEVTANNNLVTANASNEYSVLITGNTVISITIVENDYVPPVQIAKLTFPDAHTEGSAISAYTATWIAKTTDGHEFTMVNFNSNKWGNNWAWVKCGRKNNASVGKIATTFENVISKIVVTLDRIDANYVNSIVLTVKSGETAVGTVEIAASGWTQGDMSFKIPTNLQGQNYTYELAFDCKSATSNGVITVVSVEYLGIK